MSFTELLAQLPSLTPQEREQVVRRVLELDEEYFSAEDEMMLEKRMADHDANPASAVQAEQIFARLRERFGA